VHILIPNVIYDRIHECKCRYTLHKLILKTQAEKKNIAFETNLKNTG